MEVALREVGPGARLLVSIASPDQDLIRRAGRHGFQVGRAKPGATAEAPEVWLAADAVFDPGGRLPKETAATLEQYARLSDLAQSFIDTARTYGRIIISEVFLDDARKTLRPASSFGGEAGGLKYVAHGILFKFAVDSAGLYGSDYIAAKVRL